MDLASEAVFDQLVLVALSKLIERQLPYSAHPDVGRRAVEIAEEAYKRRTAALARIVDEHPHLKVLDISRTLVTADAVPLLTKLPDLWRLELSQPSFSKPLLEAIDDFASLEEFGFRGQEASIDDPDIGELVDWYGAANWIPTR